MKPEFDANKTIYVQIAENIEDDILRGHIEEESQVMSTNQFAVHYRINPATAAKGLNILVNEGILYKKRGIGMFVTTGASDRVREKRRAAFIENYVAPLIKEAAGLGISVGEIIDMLQTSGKE